MATKFQSLEQSLLVIICLNLACYKYSKGQEGIIPPLKDKAYYTASSELPPSYGFSYGPSKAGDQYLRTWWSPSTNNRTRCWLQINYGKGRYINYIKIHGGSHYPNFQNLGDLFYKNLRIRIAKLTFSDGSEETIEFEDSDRVQTFRFQKRYTNIVRIYPLRYYQAEKWNDPCISHFVAGYE